MRYLTIEQRESLVKALKSRSSVLVGEIAAALRQKDTPESIHLANRFEEVREEALADLELALDIAAVERDIAELRRVTEAQNRIHTPEYGVCADCSEVIPFTRLQAEPSAVRCIACQRAREERAGKGTPPSL
jgi:DnaK suppressor protein